MLDHFMSFDSYTRFIEDINKMIPKQRSQQWFESRTRSIGASEIGCIIDSINPNTGVISTKRYKQLYERVFLKKQQQQSLQSNYYMAWGSAMEPVVRQYAIDKYCGGYQGRMFELGSVKSGYLSCSPDGISYDPVTKTANLYEFKCPAKRIVDPENPYISRDYCYQLIQNYTILKSLGILNDNSKVIYIEMNIEVVDNDDADDERNYWMELPTNASADDFIHEWFLRSIIDRTKIYKERPDSSNCVGIKIARVNEKISDSGVEGILKWFPEAGSYFGEYLRLPDHKPPLEIDKLYDSILPGIAEKMINGLTKDNNIASFEQFCEYINTFSE